MSFPNKKSLLVTLFLLLLQCRSAQPPSVRQEIDRLNPEERIVQAEIFYQQDDKEWALYAWNQTHWQDLSSDKAQESYRLLKNWLFSRPVPTANEMQVSALYLDYDDLWLGTWNGGIYRLSLSSGERFILEQDSPSLTPKVVYRIRKSGNAFWFAMYQGLRFYNYQTSLDGWFRIAGVTGAVSDFFENSEGLFLSSLTQGTWKRTIAGDIFPLGNGIAHVTALEYQDDIGLLIGTAQQGAFRWKNQVMEPLKDLQLIFHELVHVNHIVNDGHFLWFASSGEGLFRWDYLNNEAQRISLFRSDRISALLHSGDWIFVGDERGGIAGYHLQDQKWYIWDSGRNLEFSSITALAYGNGELFYSTLAGGIYQIHWLKYLFALKEKNSKKN